MKNNSFSFAKHKWFVENINLTIKRKDMAYRDIAAAFEIFPSRLSKMMHDSNSPIQDKYIDILINKYGISNPFGNNNLSFQQSKRKWFLSSINELMVKERMTKKDVSEIFEIFPSRLSGMLNNSNAIINDKYLDILLNKYGFKNPILNVSETDSSSNVANKKTNNEQHIEENQNHFSADILINKIIELQQENDNLKHRNEMLEQKISKCFDILSL